MCVMLTKPQSETYLTRMQNINDIIQQIAAYLLMPATFLGAGGGILRAYRAGKVWHEVLAEGVSGAFIAHVFGPAAVAAVPPEWAYPAVFLTGYAGMEGVVAVYTFARGLLRQRFGGSDGSKGE